MPRPPRPQSEQEGPNLQRLETGLMGVVSREFQGHGETGAGAAAAVATWKRREWGGREIEKDDIIKAV